jgi:hypothetical protein
MKESKIVEIKVKRELQELRIPKTVNVNGIMYSDLWNCSIRDILISETTTITIET